jgi:tetratricopeptide (TPR) repeat protein
MQIEMDLAALQREIRDLHGLGRYADSLEACRRALVVSRDHFGDKHPVTASLLNNQALNHKYLGELDAAVNAFHEALRVYEEVLGATHTSAATCKLNIAKLLQLKANTQPGLDRVQLLQEAKELAEEALVAKLDNLGEKNPEVGTVMFSLGAIYNDLRMHDEAVETLKEVGGCMGGWICGGGGCLYD